MPNLVKDINFRSNTSVNHKQDEYKDNYIYNHQSPKSQRQGENAESSQRKWDGLHESMQRQECCLTFHQKKTETRKQRNSIFKVLKENYCQCRILSQNSVSLSWKLLAQEQPSSDKWTMREFTTSRPHGK